MVKLLDEVDTLEMENDFRQHDFCKLEKEVEFLKRENFDLKKLMHNFTNGKESFEKLLGAQKHAFDKGDVGYNGFGNNKSFKTRFVKASTSISFFSKPIKVT